MNLFPALILLVSVQSAVDSANLASLHPTDYTTAYQRAQQGNKPLLVLVTAEWCAPCQSLKRTTLQQMMAKQGFSDFHFALVDVDKEPSVAAKLTENRPVPQFIIFEKNGSNWLRRYSVGYHTVADLESFLAPSSPKTRVAANVEAGR